ncbi:MAG: hypothetical protein LC624_11460 [Halobacteriales archaeon]|nr:hypothetical protein [Halobacteriales archaeon]
MTANSTAPAAPGATGWFTSPVTVAFTATDDPANNTYITSGVNARSYSVDNGADQTCGATGSCSVLLNVDGIHPVKYSADDLAGNKAATKTLTVKLDQVAPATTASVQGTAGNAGWYLGDATVSLAATDATSGVNATKFRVDGGALGAYTGPFAVSGEPCHAVDYFSTDNAGNVEATQTLQVCIDMSPPVVRVLVPEEGQAYILGVLRTDEVLAAQAGLPPPPDAPAVPDKLPVTLVIGDVTVVASATDTASGVARVDFLIDGALRGSDATAPYEFLWHAGDEGAGTHVIQARAFDVAGWSATNDTTSLTIPVSAQGFSKSCRADTSVVLPPESPIVVPPELFPRVCGPVHAAVDEIPTPSVPPTIPGVPDVPELPAPPEAPPLPGIPDPTQVQPPPLPGYPPDLPDLPALPAGDALALLEAVEDLIGL